MIKNAINYRNNNGFPPTICIQLLKWCNLKCSFCRASSSPYESESLDYQDVEELLVTLSKYGKWRISLTGGEPFFWNDIEHLLKLIYDLEFPFNLTTNGYNTDGILSKIPAKYWKNGRLHVSIDGNKEIHNNIRGEKSYEKAIAFTKAARSKIPQLFVNTVLYTNPAIWGKELYTKLVLLKVDNWTIISPVKQGRWDSEYINKNNSNDYSKQFNYLKSISSSFPDSSTTLSFLDFSKSDGKYSDVVFINSNGEIKLPGFHLYNIDFPNRPLIEKVSIKGNNSAKIIFKSVQKFINSEKYML